jgi:hypothetical protein
LHVYDSDQSHVDNQVHLHGVDLVWMIMGPRMYFVTPLLVKKKERYNLFTVLSLMTRLQQQAAVVESEANHLLHMADDLSVTDPVAGHHWRRSGCDSMAVHLGNG